MSLGEGNRHSYLAVFDCVDGFVALDVFGGDAVEVVGFDVVGRGGGCCKGDGGEEGGEDN